MLFKSLRWLFLLVVVFDGSTLAHAQSGSFLPEPKRPYSSLAFELQAYPTGIIPGFTYERFVSQNSALHFRVGGQVIRHEDYGEHDDERGEGLGGSLGYRRYWSHGISLGTRVDLWANSLDWTDNIGEPNERTGQTDVLVLQPVVEATLRKFFSPKWFVQPSVAAGFEINVHTDGEDTGEGFIFLGALAVGRSF